MANTSFNRPETLSRPDTLRDANESVRDTFEEAKSKLNRNFDDVSHMATDLYDRSSVWLQDNYGKAIGGAAVVIGAGILGYFIGRNSNKTDLNL
ncbi:MAG: hypothetical protein A2X94_12725 [Bdellovibrionales bacterium GWB1_55_8]|nr:MAG: hypothetical protein A2X94_12725 [Bdellovibrionales bacterium GWB1_55_8]